MSIIYDFKSINQSANQISRHLLWPEDQSFAKPIDDSARSSLIRCEQVETSVRGADDRFPKTQAWIRERDRLIRERMERKVMRFASCAWAYDLEHDKWIKDAPA